MQQTESKSSRQQFLQKSRYGPDYLGVAGRFRVDYLNITRESLGGQAI